MDHYILDAALTVAIAIIGFFARRNDNAQQRELDSLHEQIKDAITRNDSIVKDLYEKHERDSRALQDLELKVAGQYHDRTEIDRRFQRLEELMTDGFSKIHETMIAMLNKADK